MKTRKSRILLSLTACLMALSCLLTGCDDGQKDTDTTTAASAQTTAAPTQTTTVPQAPVTEPTVSSDPWVSAIFGGGPLVTTLSKNLDRIQKSGFNTLIVWSVHVHDDGTLYLNDVKVAENGAITSQAQKRYADTWGKIKGDGSSITRVELSVGAWGCTDFENIGAMMAKDGTGEDTVLYKNFKALIDAYKADAINFDDETCYDPTILTKFGKMCGDMGVKVTLCPYTNMSVWTTVQKNLGDLVDRVYVQCYDGGAGNYNQLATLKRTFNNVDIIPGLWPVNSNMKPDAVASYLQSNLNSITGCFFWYYDDMMLSNAPAPYEEYAEAVNKLNKYQKDK